MVVLDSEHSRDHVRRERAPTRRSSRRAATSSSRRRTSTGIRVSPGFGPGPMEAVTDFLETADEFEVDRGREKLLLTFNPSGYLRRC